MKNKLSLLSIPYVVWMAIFVVAPIIMVVMLVIPMADIYMLPERKK